MLLKKIDILHLILLTLAALLLVLDLFLIKAEPSTFDGRIHITNIAQYYQALHDNEFPVRWAGGIGNYGLPTPLLSQQTTNYLGALITFITNNVVLSYKILFAFGSVLGSLLLYRFLRIYWKPNPSFVGAFLFTFAPYRIFDIYIRGDLPEFFASAFIPLLLVSLYYTITKRKLPSFFLLVATTTLLICTHPLVFFISLFIAVPYTVVLLIQQKKRLESIVTLCAAMFLSLGISAWYIFPLLYETKYLYLGQTKNNFVIYQFLSLENYIQTTWNYGNSFIRGNFVPVGIVNTIITICGIGALLGKYRNIKRHLLFSCFVFLSVFLIFLTTSFSQVFFTHITLLGNIQFPWRMVIALDIVTVVITTELLSNITRYQTTIFLSIILFVSLLAFPGLYGKNYIYYPQQHYFFTIDNPYTIIANPIWSGETIGYPVKRIQSDIIGGQGQILTRIVHNASRTYRIFAKTPLQMIDYTFYFPGWTVIIDGQSVPIEYQDPNHRGVITYHVPSGEHTINVFFKNTRDRMIGNAISIFSFIFCILILFFFWIKKYFRRSFSFSKDFIKRKK